MAEIVRYDVLVLGSTPGGIMAAVAAARRGRTVLLLERSSHIGGLPANGLGATDIATRGATGGLFAEFVGRVKQHYEAAYGPASRQVTDSSDGHHFEPHMAEAVLEAMVAEQPSITLLRQRQFDVAAEHVGRDATGRPNRLTVLNRETGERETHAARVFIDATYEGDLAAAFGAEFRLGREGFDAHQEPLAGRVYKRWGGPVCDGSTLAGDDAIQAYNYRLCLTADPANRAPFGQPEGYDREEYASLVDDVLHGVTTGNTVPDGIARLTNMVKLPNGKHDGNNQHLAFLSTDLPEENWPWPTADWAWRDAFADRLRRYTLGLFWFGQHDEALPADFRERCQEWGLAADEYQDHDHFPRQVYVREGRRVVGLHWFTAHDARPTAEGARPPLHATSVTASHYAIDSHACHKREPGCCHLDGFLSSPTKPYTVPYGVIVPVATPALLCPVPVSATHLGYGTLRMEPCWMALGQAAGVAADLAIAAGCEPAEVPIERLQDELLAGGAVLVWFRDARPGDPGYATLQRLALRGVETAWQARLREPVTDDDLAAWAAALGREPAGCEGLSRGEALARLGGETE